MYWLEADRAASGSPVPVAQITPEAFARMLTLAKRKETLESLVALGQKNKLKPFALGLRATLQTGATVRRLTSENVVGVLRGSDPQRSKEYVVYTAHMDHVGRGPAVEGDDIYNGAVDDAAGVAGLIEVARAFAALPRRPPRSILFLGVTAEEKGLLGSDYLRPPSHGADRLDRGRRQQRLSDGLVDAARRDRARRRAQQPRGGRPRGGGGARPDRQPRIPRPSRPTSSAPTSTAS